MAPRTDSENACSETLISITITNISSQISCAAQATESIHKFHIESPDSALALRVKPKSLLKWSLLEQDTPRKLTIPTLWSNKSPSQPDSPMSPLVVYLQPSKWSTLRLRPVRLKGIYTQISLPLGAETSILDLSPRLICFISYDLPYCIIHSKELPSPGFWFVPTGNALDRMSIRKQVQNSCFPYHKSFKNLFCVISVTCNMNKTWPFC